MDYYEVTTNSLSHCSCFLNLRYNEAEISTASGFFIRHKGQYFLITNWHNFAGKNSETKKLLDPKSGAVPNNFKINLKYRIDEERLMISEAVVKLYNNKGEPLWYEHPQMGGEIDVGILKIDNNFEGKELNIISINDNIDAHIEPRITMDVFVLGFPISITNKFGLPIWKKATIATEPKVDFDLPRILIDTATRKGMSGAPVVMKTDGLYKDTRTGKPKLGGEKFDLLGVYSGRLGEDEFKAQLGIVWDKKVIYEIIEAKERPDLVVL